MAWKGKYDQRTAVIINGRSFEVEYYLVMKGKQPVVFWYSPGTSNKLMRFGVGRVDIDLALSKHLGFQWAWMRQYELAMQQPANGSNGHEQDSNH